MDDNTNHIPGDGDLPPERAKSGSSDHGEQSSASAPLLEVRHLAKSYESKQILTNVNFDLDHGETLVILGRSGSGKSVNLRLINGLESPDAGSVHFDGVELTSLSEKELYPARKRMSMLFQSGALFDSMTVLQNVAFPLREHTDLDDDAIAAVVKEKLAQVRLENIEHQLPSDLSGGMRKRVALARSLALDPELVLYDEPTTGLDPVTAAAIGELIAESQAKLGSSAIVVTHEMALARRVADRVAFLYEGSFRFIGTWEQAENSDDPILTGFINGRAEIDHAA